MHQLLTLSSLVLSNHIDYYGELLFVCRRCFEKQNHSVQNIYSFQ